MSESTDPVAPTNNTDTDGFNDKYLSCPICFETYKESHIPKILPCGHTFCSKCIPTFLTESMKCPLCKAQVRGSKDQDFPINFTVNGLLLAKELPKVDTAEQLKKRWEALDEGMESMRKLVNTTVEHMKTKEHEMGAYVRRCQQSLDKIRGEDGQKKEVLVVMEERIRRANAALFDELERMKEFSKFMTEDILPSDEYFVNKNYLKRKIEPNPEDMKEYYDRLIDKYPGNDRDAQLAFAKNVRKSVSDFQTQMESFFPRVNYSSRGSFSFEAASYVPRRLRDPNISLRTALEETYNRFNREEELLHEREVRERRRRLEESTRLLQEEQNQLRQERLRLRQQRTEQQRRTTSQMTESERESERRRLEDLANELVARRQQNNDIESDLDGVRQTLGQVRRERDVLRATRRRNRNDRSGNDQSSTTDASVPPGSAPPARPAMNSDLRLPLLPDPGSGMSSGLATDLFPDPVTGMYRDAAFTRYPLSPWPDAAEWLRDVIPANPNPVHPAPPPVNNIHAIVAPLIPPSFDYSLANEFISNFGVPGIHFPAQNEGVVDPVPPRSPIRLRTVPRRLSPAPGPAPPIEPAPQPQPEDDNDVIFIEERNGSQRREEEQPLIAIDDTTNENDINMAAAGEEENSSGDSVEGLLILGSSDENPSPDSEEQNNMEVDEESPISRTEVVPSRMLRSTTQRQRRDIQEECGSSSICPRSQHRTRDTSQ